MGIRAITEVIKDISVFFFLVIPGILILLPVLGIFLVWRLTWVLLASTFYRKLSLESFGPIELLLYSVEPHEHFVQQPVKFVVVSAIVDGQLAESELRQLIQNKVLSCREENGRLTFFRLQKKIMQKFGYIGFGFDKNFNIRNHIRSLQMSLTENSLSEFIVSQNSAPLPINSPLWEILLVQNYNGLDQTFILFRFHHLYMDGVSAMRFCECCFSPGSISRPNRSTIPKIQQPSLSLASLYKSTIGLPRQYWTERQSGSLHSRFIDSNSQYDTFPKLLQVIPLMKFKKLRERCGIKFTEAILTALSYAMDETNVACTIPVCFTVPSPVTSDAIGNNFQFLGVRLPAGSMPLDQRIQQCRQALRDGKDAVVAKVNGMILLLGTILPPQIFRKFFRKVLDFEFVLVSNLPGPSESCAILNHPLLMTHYNMLPSPNPQLSITILSYNGNINISMNGSSVMFERKTNFFQFVENFEFGLKILFETEKLEEEESV